MKKVWVLTMLVLLVSMIGASAPLQRVSAQAGKVYVSSEQCGSITQSFDEFFRGTWVHMYGDGFAPGIYQWSIVGDNGSRDPEQTIASGELLVGDSGEFCFQAYEVNWDDDGVYFFYFGEAEGHYHITPCCMPSPTPTVTATPTLTPTAYPSKAPTVGPSGGPNHLAAGGVGLLALACAFLMLLLKWSRP